MSEVVKVVRVYCCDECGRVTGDENPWRYEDDFSGPWCQPSCKRLVAVPVLPLDAVKGVVDALGEARITLADVARTRKSDAWGMVVSRAEQTIETVDAALATYRSTTEGEADG